MKKIYLPGLNALRALAAITVVWAHSLQHLHLISMVSVASHSVTLFFVLSGFLITYLLIHEKEKTNTISIKKFYIRRTLRIWPLYFLYLFLILGLVFFLTNFSYSAHGSLVWYYVFFSANFLKLTVASIPYLGHYWSLSVEEQFYLWWPWFMKKIKRPVASIFALIFLLIFAKIIAHSMNPNGAVEKMIHYTRFHTMLIGAIGAFWFKKKNRVVNFLIHPVFQIGAWCIIMAIAFGKLYAFGIGFLRTEIFACAVLVVILSQVSEKGLPFLENQFFNFLGKISYGMYILHMLAIFVLLKIAPATLWNHTSFVSLVFLITVGAATISYYSIEEPFLKIKERFMVVKSGSSK